MGIGSNGALSDFIGSITSIRQFRDGYTFHGVSGNDHRYAALFTKQVAEQSFPDGTPLAPDDAAVLWRFGNTDAKIVLHAFLFVLSEGRFVVSLGIRTKNGCFDGVFRRTS